MLHADQIDHGGIPNKYISSNGFEHGGENIAKQIKSTVWNARLGTVGGDQFVFFWPGVLLSRKHACGRIPVKIYISKNKKYNQIQIMEALSTFSIMSGRNCKA